MINDELYHYGVPGMKWGVRRSNNALGRIDKKSKKDDGTKKKKGKYNNNKRRVKVRSKQR